MTLSLKNIVRDPSDIGEQRTKITPSPEVILKNIENFLLQWNKIEVNSTQLLPPAAIKEIEKLKIHVTKGCLSYIPPSGGTNRNEVLHKTLNKSLRRSRIGLELAIALLGFYFYRWNEKKNLKLSNQSKRITCIPPVEIYNSDICESKESFGVPLSVQESFDASTFEFSDNFSDTDEIINSVNYLLENHSEDEDSEDSLLSDDLNDETSDDESCPYLLDNTGISHIIEQASNFCLLHKHLKNIKGHISLARCYDLIHLKNALCLLSSNDYKRIGNDQRDIDSFLQLNGMQRIEIPGDGNCFFLSVATMIKQMIIDGNLSSESKLHLLALGVGITSGSGGDQDVNQMALSLRQVVVKEWLSNPLDYKPFLTSGQDYESEAILFLQDGHFASELGNSMPLAATNALRIPIMVFSDMSNFPVLPLCPRDKVLNDNPICLAYDMRFSGHYDAIRPITEEKKQETDMYVTLPQSDTAKQSQVSCRCGQGAKRNKKEFTSCQVFKSGCKCFQNVVGCTSFCQCINCKNPYGERISDAAPVACSSRKRRHHDRTTERQNGKVYTDTKSGGLLTVHWTLFEELVLMEVMLFLLSKDKLDLETLYNEYKHMVNVLQPTSIKHCLGIKTEKQVATKLSAFTNSQNVFETLMKEQVRLNFGNYLK